MDLINDIVSKIKELEEIKLTNELKEKGIITDACLCCSPKVANQLKQVLYDNKIQIPLMIDRRVEEDKLYMITDKEIVENVKKNLEWKYKLSD